MADFEYPSDDEIEELLAGLRSSGDPEVANIMRKDIWFCTPLTPFQPDVASKYMMTYHPKRFANVVCQICGYGTDSEHIIVPNNDVA